MKSKPIVKQLNSKPISLLEMEIAISKYFNTRQNIIVPNLSYGFLDHEADLFIIKKNGYGVEVEIKRSRTDFLKDFKKEHRHLDSDNRIREYYYAFPETIIDSCINKVPEEWGILKVMKVLDYDKNESVVLCRLIRTAKPLKNARKLTTDEQLKIARLGVLRVWKLKEKLLR